MSSTHLIKRDEFATVAQQAWFFELIESLKGVITEGVHNSRWLLLETYHETGRLIVESEDKFPSDINPVVAVAKAINKSPRTLYHAVQFYKKFPDINALPEGKNISWHKVVNDLLPENKKPKAQATKELEAKIWQFIDDLFPAERKPKKEFIMEVVKEWEGY